ncbi:MAG: TetR family transcriptional regulator [Thermogemmatispora sp.]|jgi:AcrR family transcriptional regulator|uniref:TetR/AcrR family transcriptional regulator n=1 Tax=Thermogemmatispora sp. TaxID=1968838 RepID=UPI0019FD49C0|nr:TetR/AcrR family transcriptional regulator [Thermogemmatispora sp.]MBE3567926.1 TetR family transcriptional regulator [Thermogemmatispora sp.]
MSAETPRTKSIWLQQVRELISVKVGDDALVEQRYHELIETATSLFLERGFHGTSVPEIARAMGMSVGGLYRYISQKEDILLLILASILWQFHQEIEPKLQQDSDPAEKLRHSIAAYYHNIARNTGGALLAYRESYVLQGKARDLLKQLELRTNSIFEEIVREGIARGVFKPYPPDLVAYNIIMLAHAWALKRWYWSGRETIEQYIETQTEFILSALRQR